jgi:hypothetical protein
MHNIPLVKIQAEERLAASSELNPASCLVTGCGEARGMGYWAATQVKEFSQCSEAICWSCGCKSHHCNSQFGSVVISDSRWGDSVAESSEGLRTSQDDPGMTKTVPITEEGNGKAVRRLADEVAKQRSQDDDKPGGARTSGFWRDRGYTSSRLITGIRMLAQPKYAVNRAMADLNRQEAGNDGYGLREPKATAPVLHSTASMENIVLFVPA